MSHSVGLQFLSAVSEAGTISNICVQSWLVKCLCVYIKVCTQFFFYSSSQGSTLNYDFVLTEEASFFKAKSLIVILTVNLPYGAKTPATLVDEQWHFDEQESVDVFDPPHTVHFDGTCDVHPVYIYLATTAVDHLMIPGLLYAAAHTVSVLPARGIQCVETLSLFHLSTGSGSSWDRADGRGFGAGGWSCRGPSGGQHSDNI